MSIVSPSTLAAVILMLAGCASPSTEMKHPKNFPPQIPKTAVLVGQDGDRQTFHASDAGRVYVYDADLARVAFTTHIEPGQRLFLDPRENRATLDGKVIFANFLDRSYAYRIYFDPSDTAATSQPVHSGR